MGFDLLFGWDFRVNWMFFLHHLNFFWLDFLVSYLDVLFASLDFFWDFKVKLCLSHHDISTCVIPS